MKKRFALALSGRLSVFEILGHYLAIFELLLLSCLCNNGSMSVMLLLGSVRELFPSDFGQIMERWSAFGYVYLNWTTFLLSFCLLCEPDVYLLCCEGHFRCYFNYPCAMFPIFLCILFKTVKFWPSLKKCSSALKRPLLYVVAFHFFEHYPLLVGIEILLDWLLFLVLGWNCYAGVV